MSPSSGTLVTVHVLILDVRCRQCSTVPPFSTSTSVGDLLGIDGWAGGGDLPHAVLVHVPGS